MRQILRNLDLTSGSSPPNGGWGQADRGHVVRLSVVGELDIATVDSLTQAAINALELPVRVLILDIHGVTFCGAAGVNALVHIRQAASETGSRFVLAGMQPTVTRVLDLVGLGAMIPLPLTRNAPFAGTDASPAELLPSCEPIHSRPLQAA